jgi:Leucine-rich repeat (LRR) protein
MQDLLATGNPNLSGPPQWVVAQGMPGIRNFYESLSQAETSLSLEITNQASCTVVPPDLFHLTSLTALTISSCPIDSLQDDICMMMGLTALEISHCSLKKVPSLLSKCLKMASINLQANMLSSLPIGWAELTNMNSLSLAQNRFELVPPCIQYFIYLSWLDMCDNLLASIPSWYELSKLKMEYDSLLFYNHTCTGWSHYLTWIVSKWETILFVLFLRLFLNLVIGK